MKDETTPVAGYFSLTLHAHLPYVLHHGTWPHGLEWLLEAAAETYLPLLRMVRRLDAEGVSFPLNLSLSPVLLEQLAHPDFKAELPRYLERKIVAAQEDAAFFAQAGETGLLELARHWEAAFGEALRDLQRLKGDLVAGFREAAATGGVSLLTSAATHGYVPLLGTDASVRGQFATAVRTHTRQFGVAPAGVWLPECGYRPAGPWRFPVETAAGDELQLRAGTESALAEAGLQFTFVDAPMVPAAARYRPHTIAESGVAVFARDPRTAFQVWSAQGGYPGEFAYLDFHKKRWPGGHRYWRVTGAGLGMEDKQPYSQDAAAERTRAHAEHFVELVAETLRAQTTPDGKPAVLCAPFDLELFGHWWHEGMEFLENVGRVLAAGGHGVEAITGEEYLERFGTAGAVRMTEGSWGAGGDNRVWLNGETTSEYQQVYAAELQVREAAESAAWTDGGTGERIARQMCLELMLLESSDWTTLITTGAARDYAERRVREHADGFAAALRWWYSFLADGSVDEGALTALEVQDCIFADVDPAAWRVTSAAVMRSNGVRAAARAVEIC